MGRKFGKVHFIIAPLLGAWTLVNVYSALNSRYGFGPEVLPPAPQEGQGQADSAQQPQQTQQPKTRFLIDEKRGPPSGK